LQVHQIIQADAGEQHYGSRSNRGKEQAEDDECDHHQEPNEMIVPCHALLTRKIGIPASVKEAGKNKTKKICEKEQD